MGGSPAPASMLIPIDNYPIGGLNVHDNELQLGETEVADCINVFFTKKQVMVRPGDTAINLTGLGAAEYVGASASVSVNDTYYQLMTQFTGANKLFKYPISGGAVTEITGPGVGFNAQVFRPIAVNGVVLIAGNSGGLVRWDPAGTVYTIVAAAKFNYVISHLSRAVAAYDLAATNGKLIFAASKVGDETNWTDFVGGAYTNTMIEMGDQITGLANLNDQVVIFFKKGIHIATPTGVANPPYTTRCYDKGMIGCYRDTSLAVYRNTAYFIGVDNVYSFSFADGVVPIGGQIKDLLMQYVIDNGLSPTGFISSVQTNNRYPKVCYNLIPNSTSTTFPALSYNINDQTWSRLNLFTSPPTSFAAWAQQEDNRFGFAYSLGDANPAKVWSWTDILTIANASTPFIKTRVFQVGDPRKDYVLRRVMIRHRDASNGNLTVKVDARLGKTAVTSGSITQALSGNLDNYWVRTWFDIQLTGQHFQLTITMPNTVNNFLKFALDYVGLEFTESGAYRG